MMEEALKMQGGKQKEKWNEEMQGSIKRSRQK
jgi:hypothetical protein